MDNVRVRYICSWKVSICKWEKAKNEASSHETLKTFTSESLIDQYLSKIIEEAAMHIHAPSAVRLAEAVCC